MLMVFFCKFMDIKVTEQLINPIIVFDGNFKVAINKNKQDRKITK